MKSLSLKTVVVCALVAAGLVIYTDYFTKDAAGVAVSYFVVCGSLLLAVFNFRLGTLAAMFVLFAFPTFPRDLLNLYQDLDATGQKLVFASPKYLTLAGFALIIWLFVALAGLATLRIAFRGLRFGTPAIRRIFTFSMLLTALLLTAAFATVATGGGGAPLKEIVSDLRFPVMLALGAIIGCEFIHCCGSTEEASRQLLQLLVVVTVISGFKVAFFILDDRLSGGLFRLSFSNPFNFIFPLVLTILWLGRRFGLRPGALLAVFIFGVIASVPDGRGPIIAFMVEIVVLFFLVRRFERPRVGALAFRGAGLLCAVALLLVGIAASSPRMWEFLQWKGSFLYDKSFYRQLDKSPAVRIAEFQNIVAQNARNGVGLLVGKGAGGAFTYKSYSLPFILERNDYSAPELASGIFYHPHTFVNYWLLKGGVLAVALYLGVFYWVWKRALRSLRVRLAPFPILMALLVPTAILEAFWRPDLTMIIAIFAAVMAGYDTGQRSPEAGAQQPELGS